MGVKRPLKFKLDAYRFYTEGLKPLEAFAKAGAENNVSLSGCMTNRGYASSYMSDDVKNYLRKRSSTQEVITYFEQWGLDINF